MNAATLHRQPDAFAEPFDPRRSVAMNPSSFLVIPAKKKATLSRNSVAGPATRLGSST
jgi:hypothetical protein